MPVKVCMYALSLQDKDATRETACIRLAAPPPRCAAALPPPAHTDRICSYTHSHAGT